MVKNMQRKAGQADAMFSSLVAHMNAALAIDRAAVGFDKKVELPSWV